MKILVLCKRSPQSRDLWNRPYGRFYNLSKHLAENGHEVHLVLLNYEKGNEWEEWRDGMHWHSINLQPNPLRYYMRVKALAKRTGADWLLGFSDIYFGICAYSVAKQTGARSLIDAYDNYESYLPWCYPLHGLWRHALRHCDAVTAAGPNLLALMCSKRKQQCSAVIEMCADPAFTPGSKQSSREKLGLDPNRPIVAYCGSIYRSRGVDELRALIIKAAAIEPDAQWVISGRRESGIKLPENCHYLGYVDDDCVVDVIRSADVILCVSKPGKFGDFSYPVKIYEALSVEVPIVAFRTPSVEFVMRDEESSLVPFGDNSMMAAKISTALHLAAKPKPNKPTWADEAAKLEEIISS